MSNETIIPSIHKNLLISIGGIILLCCTSLNGMLHSEEELHFGSHIDKIEAFNINREKVPIPQENIITFLFLLNVKLISHRKILSELDFLIINLNLDYKKVKLIGVSKGEAVDFLEVQSKYNIKIDLINDEKEIIFKVFNFICKNCFQIVPIDRESKIRYLSSNFDPVFLREIIQRYAK